jgi:hypothetical protein
MAWPVAPVVAQASPAATVADLLPALLQVTSLQAAPSAQATASPNCLLGLVGCGTTPGTSGPCVAGVLLCDGNVISQPTPCTGGLLCNPPPPSPCVGGEVLCTGAVVGPGSSPPPGVRPGRPTKGAGTTGTAAEGLGTTNGALALGVPPGVGLVPLSARQLNAGDTPNPDGISELLSLSIRGGLSVGGSQLWPALAMLQAVLLLVIVGAFAARRVLEASKPLAD